MDRFGQVLRSDRLGVMEIGHSAGDFKDAIVRTGAQARAAYCQDLDVRSMRSSSGPLTWLK